MLKSLQIGIAYKRNFLGRYTCKKSPRVIKGQKPSKFRKFFSKKSTFFCIFSILEVDGLFFQYLSPFPCVWTAARFLILSKSGSRYKCSLEPRARSFLLIFLLKLRPCGRCLTAVLRSVRCENWFFRYLSPFPPLWAAARSLIPSKSGSRYKCSLEPRALQILHWASREPQGTPSQAIRSSTSSALPKWRRGPQTQDPKLTWLVLGEDQAARSHRVEQLTALWGL